MSTASASILRWDLANYSPASPGYADALQWVNDQNGLGSGACQQNKVPILLASVERHEGIGRAPNSHVGVGNQVFLDERPEELVEALYTQQSDVNLRNTAFTTVVGFLNGGPYAAAQQQFDQQDSPIVFSSAGCVFDFDPNDN